MTPSKSTPHLRNLHIVAVAQHSPRHEPRLGVRINVEICRAPYGRSRFFNLRPRDLTKLVTIAERMETRR